MGPTTKEKGTHWLKRALNPIHQSCNREAYMFSLLAANELPLHQPQANQPSDLAEDSAWDSLQQLTLLNSAQGCLSTVS
eukprot:752320-Pelagomonas_calceolata.AAC.1